VIKLAEAVDMFVYTPVCLPAPGVNFTGEHLLRASEKKPELES
jgi:hypothetical protein